MATKTKRPQKKQKSVMTPVIIIIIAIALAGGAGLYLSRQSAQPTPVASNSSGSPNSPGTPFAAGPRLPMPLGGGHFRGSSGAPITLVEFGDYQCPTCAAFSPVVNDLLRQHADQVRLEFHYFPLRSIHRNAIAAATAAEAASEQDRFWEMHDLLFQRQPEWANLPDAKPQFIIYARQLNLDIDRFTKSMDSPDVQQRVLQDENKAQRANIDSVPTFYVNGVKMILPAQNAEAFFRLIQQYASKS